MITRDDLLPMPLLAGLPVEQVDAIAARAADLTLEKDEWLIQEGEQAAFFFLLRGEVAVHKLMGGEERLINVLHPGDHFGEIPLMLGSTALASFRADQPTRVARLEVDDFHELILTSRALGDQLFSNMVQRLTRARDVTVGIPRIAITLVGQRWDPACHELRDFLARNRVTFTWVDLADEGAAARVPGGFADGTPCPLLVLEDGTRLMGPSLREAADHIPTLRTRPSVSAAEGCYDVVIVGGGPAGLAASVYGASEGLKTVLIEKLAPGGQAGTSTRIENYLGFPVGLSGDELSIRALRQAKRFEAEIVCAREAISLTPRGADGDNSTHMIGLDGDDCLRARAVVVATGVSWRRLRAEGVDRLIGRGVYYGAARTEAQRTRGRHIHLLGGGNSAGQAAMWFSNYADKVSMLVRGPSLAASMSQYLIDQLKTRRNVEIRFNTEVIAVDGQDHVEQITLRDRVGGIQHTELTGGVFILIGANAETDWLPAAIVRDTPGYICTGRDMLQALEERRRQGANGSGLGPSWALSRDPYLLETSVPGIFAAGDVRHGSIKRCASGVGEGSMAIAFVHQYLTR
jgi:thioredoxin reductase (NADPH)